MPYQSQLRRRSAIRNLSANNSTIERREPAPRQEPLQVSRQPDDAEHLDPPPAYSVHNPSSTPMQNPPQYSEFDRVAERVRRELIKAERLRLHCFYGELGCLTSEDAPISQDHWQNIYEEYMLEVAALPQDDASRSPDETKYTRTIDVVSSRLGLDHNLTCATVLRHANRPEILRDDIAQMVAQGDLEALGTQLRTDRMLVGSDVNIIDSEFERNFLRLNIDRTVKEYLGRFPMGEYFMLRDAGGVDCTHAGWKPYRRAGC